MPKIRPAIKAALIGCFWLLFLSAYFTRLPLPEFGHHVADLVWALLACNAAAGLGHGILQRWLSDDLRPLEVFVFSTAIGFGLLSLGMVLLGTGNLWNSSVVRVGIVLLSGSGFYPARDLFKRFQAYRVADREESGIQWPIILVAVGMCIALLIALAPITYYDSLVYHFALPAAYKHAGGWVGLQSLIYSAFPQNLEMLWTLGLLLRSDIVANFMAIALAALLVLATLGFGRRFLDEGVGLLASGLLAAMPTFLLLSTGGYVDIGLTLYAFLNFYAFCLWREDRRWATLALAGALGGLALGVKYTGGIPFAITGVLLLWELRKGPWKTLAQSAALYGGAGVIVFLPWMIKNTIYVGNPVFPFLYRFGNHTLNPWVRDAALGYFRGLTEYQSRSPWELLRLLWDVAAHGMDFGSGMDVLGDFGWALPIALIPCLWLCRRTSTVTKFMLAYAVLFFIPWGMARPVLRFLMPLAPVLVLLAAEGWSQGIRLQPPEIQWIARSVMGLLLASSVFIFFYVTSVLSIFTVPLGLEGRETFLLHRLNYYGAASFINQHLPPESSLFVLGDQRGYYYERRVQISPVFNENPLVTWANESTSAMELKSRIRREGMTHIVVNGAEMQRLATYHSFNFTPEGERRWAELKNTLAKRIYQDRSCEVFEL